MAHDCMDYRNRVVFEGDDVAVERCEICGKIRFESDGVRPMAWLDQRNPNGGRWTYAYQPSHNDPDAPEIWKVVDDSRDWRPVPEAYDPPEWGAEDDA